MTGTIHVANILNMTRKLSDGRRSGLMASALVPGGKFATSRVSGHKETKDKIGGL